MAPVVLMTAGVTAFGGLAASAAAVAPVTVVAAPVDASSAAPGLPSRKDVNRADGTVVVVAQAAPARPARPALRKATPVRTKIVRASRSTKRRAAASSDGWVRPGSGVFTSGYGYRWGRLHAGIDMGLPVGSSIVAAASGRVVKAGVESGYGNVVRVEHEGGIVTVYAHLSSIGVSAGDKVGAGELIARSGNTGRSTGPHLHFEVRLGGEQPVDPRPFLRSRGVRV